MYASVGSYICQAWRNLKLTPIRWPGTIATSIAGAAIYINFITNAYVPDVRWFIVVVLVLTFWRTRFQFQVNNNPYQMLALVSFMLIGFFIWTAENIATFFGAWKYAHQHAGWKMVKWHKITSWTLLVIVSIIIVGQLKKIKQNLHKNQ